MLLAPLCAGQGLSLDERVLDGTGEREAHTPATEDTPEVIQVQSPHHGTGQLPVSQVLYLAGKTRRGQSWVPRLERAGANVLPGPLPREGNSRHPRPEPPHHHDPAPPSVQGT